MRIATQHQARQFQLKTAPSRSWALSRMEDVSFWLAILLVLSLHSFYDPAQDTSAGAVGPDIEHTQATTSGWQKAAVGRVEQSRSAG